MRSEGGGDGRSEGGRVGLVRVGISVGASLTC